MAAKPYVVELPYATSLPGRANIVVLWANDSTTALDACKAHFSGDSETLWDAATVTEIKETTDGLEGFRFHVAIVDKVTSGGDTYEVLYEATITAAEGDDVDDMGADMVTALEAAGGADLTPAYDSGTNVLTIAAGGDGLGDAHVIAEVLFPVTWGTPSKALTGAVTTIVDEGEASAALSCTLVAQAVPTIIGTYRK